MLYWRVVPIPDRKLKMPMWSFPTLGRGACSRLSPIMLTLTADEFVSMAKRAVVPSLSGGVPRGRSSGLNLERMSDSARAGSAWIASRTCSINDVWDSEVIMVVKAKVKASIIGYYRYSANGALFLTLENYGV